MPISMRHDNPYAPSQIRERKRVRVVRNSFVTDCIAIGFLWGLFLFADTTLWYLGNGHAWFLALLLLLGTLSVFLRRSLIDRRILSDCVLLLCPSLVAFPLTNDLTWNDFLRAEPAIIMAACFLFWIECLFPVGLILGLSTVIYGMATNNPTQTKPSINHIDLH